MNTLLSSVLLALCALTVLTSPLEERKEDTNFSASCNNIVVNTTSLTLSATCIKADGIGMANSTIGLDPCIGNINGELNVGHNFSQSCSDISASASGIELFASCRTPSGTTLNTSLDLNIVYSNINGILTCP